MSCSNKNKDNCQVDIGRGCFFCHEGDEAHASPCEGCYKLHSYDWMEEYPDLGEENIFEVRFKNTRKGFFKNVNNLPLAKGDIVAVEASPGHDIGVVSLTGDMVARQMRRVGFSPQNGEYKKIYRKAKPYDIEKWQEAISLEHETMIRSRQIASDMGLQMKIGDVEYQGDRIKAIFYYIADERVDFRELIKVFAEQFNIRVEMKQIGARQEAGRIGGLGSCGRELCCASWISGFVSVTTNAARHQEISLNPQKLAGQCGKLKCCLIYELDAYMDSRKDMPRVNQPLQAVDGDYHHCKSDILGRTMSFSTSPTELAGLVTVSFDRVREIVEQNRRGIKVDRIQDAETRDIPVADPDYVNVIGEDSITRFDKQARSRNPRRKGRSDNRGGGAKAGAAQRSQGNAESGQRVRGNAEGGQSGQSNQSGQGGQGGQRPQGNAEGNQRARGKGPENARPAQGNRGNQPRRDNQPRGGNTGGNANRRNDDRNRTGNPSGNPPGNRSGNPAGNHSGPRKPKPPKDRDGNQ